MSRKANTDVAEDEARPSAAVVDETDHHGFWDSARLDGDENDDAFAIVLDTEGDDTGEHETLLYMGNVVPVDADELTRLADWAESMACWSCTRRFADHQDLERLKHDECRKALRAGHLLRRYS